MPPLSKSNQRIGMPSVRSRNWVKRGARAAAVDRHEVVGGASAAGDAIGDPVEEARAVTLDGLAAGRSRAAGLDAACFAQIRPHQQIALGSLEGVKRAHDHVRDAPGPVVARHQEEENAALTGLEAGKAAQAQAGAGARLAAGDAHRHDGASAARP